MTYAFIIYPATRESRIAVSLFNYE